MRRTRIELVPNAWKAFMLTTTPTPQLDLGSRIYANHYTNAAVGFGKSRHAEQTRFTYIYTQKLQDPGVCLFAMVRRT